MNDRLSPSGHIPLNKATLDCMSFEERYFWNDFLHGAMEAIDKEKARGTPTPYKFTQGLHAMFQMAVEVYDGDKYCQVQQIRELFDCESAEPIAEATAVN